MQNSVTPDQTAPLDFVWSDQSINIFRVNTILCEVAILTVPFVISATFVRNA